MQSFEINQVGPNSNDKCPYKRRRNMGVTQGDDEGRDCLYRATS